MLQNVSPAHTFTKTVTFSKMGALIGKNVVNVWVPVWASLVQVFVSFRVTSKEEIELCH